MAENRRNAIVIGANEEAVFSIGLAHRHGLRVCALDGNPEAAGMPAADEAFPVDINDLEAVFAITDPIRPVIVVPAPIGHCLTTVGAVNDRYGLPGVSEQAAGICTDKYLFHETLAKNGLRDASVCLIRKGQTLDRRDTAAVFAAACGSRQGEENRGGSQAFPGALPASGTEQNEKGSACNPGTVILKPRDGSGSRGVVSCRNEEELWKAICRVEGGSDGEDPHSLPSGDRRGEDARETKTSGFPEDYIVETCIPGEEYGIDGGYVNGEFRLTLLRHKKNTPLPYRQCVGYSSVSPEEAPAFYENCRRLMQKAGDAVGLSDCVVHADLIRRKRLHEACAGGSAQDPALLEQADSAGGCANIENETDEPFLIEMSARPSGHNLSNLFTPMAAGVTVVEDFLQLGLRQRDTCDGGQTGERRPEEALFLPRETRKLLIRYYDLKPGTVIRVPSGEQVAKWKDAGVLLDYHCTVRPGDRVDRVTNGASVMGRGYFILQGRDDAELEQQAQRVLREFIIE